ncbi:DUF4124 domain-containing protein [Delftia sp. 67-8]|uniref:DUF4124 domain-containing protein n=1 Tax=Delftia sp. 67-8 TaxID=1895749 RepID=UPI000AA6AEE6|nr:DUF4124 domain-containing protein [Delftia sp. 67-8]
MRHLACCLAVSVLGIWPTAHAQVFKCKGPGGQFTYSDRPCEARSTGGMMLRERTYEEKMQERQQAYDAELRKQERRMAEQQQAWEVQQQALQRQATAPVPSAGGGYAERLANRNAGVQSNLGRKAPKARKPQFSDEDFSPPPANRITHCNGGYCYDNQGGSYHSIGNGYMAGPGGARCTQSGGQMDCR